MDISNILDFIVSQGIWCVLFVWLLFDSQKKATAREEKLTEIMQQQSEKLRDITDTLSQMNERLEKVEEALEKD